MEAGDGGEAAVRTRHHILTADYACEITDALSDQFGMLDKVADRIDYAGNQDLAGRQLDVFENRPFMLMAGGLTLRTEFPRRWPSARYR